MQRCRRAALWFLIGLSGSALAGPADAVALENQLADHPSPYLALHGDDPVAWQDWGPAAIARARQTGRLLLLSSGYFACHWCHVMQRESFRAAEIAALLNRNFVPVKIDRELHGALDAYLIDYLKRTTGQAGWPLNVFLTPEGYPLIGTTYLPPDRFGELLVRTNRVWNEERERMRDLALRTSLQLQRAEPARPRAVQSRAALQAALLGQVMQRANMLEGGFGHQSRFPMAPQLMVLLELYRTSPEPQLGEFLQLTLDSMAAQGLRDHLAGGFFRYTVDPGWQVPHFEKMLYTQALLAEVFLAAADVFEREDYAEVARDTLHFVAREMRGPLGGYVASFSAVDETGAEGGAYLWTIEQLRAVLGEVDTAVARRFWAMLEPSPFDAVYLPRRVEPVGAIARALDRDPQELAALLEQLRRRLLTARASRALPVDHKELAGWNGLTLAAFAKAAQRWDEPVFHSAAQRIRHFLRESLWDGEVLRRSVSVAADGSLTALGRASLADYAYVAYGMNAVASLSRDPRDRAFAAALLRLAWQQFHTPAGWRRDDRPLIPGMAAQPALADSALPAPSALVIRLSLASDSPLLVEQAVGAVEQGRARAQAEPFWYAGHHALLMPASGDRD